MKNYKIFSFLLSLIITLIVLNIIKLPFLISFIVGSILWNILDFNIKKLLKEKYEINSSKRKK
ncbi:hypothetical protein [Caminibacter mediatlanticus]|uniref:Uncharacterized protein n=1 Tax=Caminibacter mediatlanticus TB-2 TaxID=391592 RepID=A0AAI9AG53_9BACT|nr:hypothetical protein [Caminibacter mediatlanticus]EDM22884.1 hypothetical protein CMTB2_07735 [Caminibacter mediatlanticus TB-2]